MAGRIYYQSTLFRRPAGGVRTIFRHVAALRALGWDARIISNMPPDVRPTWFASEVPVDSTHVGVRVDGRDVIVLPEVADTAVRQMRPTRAPKVLFCQNQYGVFRGLADNAATWQEVGVNHAMYCSQSVRLAVERCFSFQSSGVVRCAVNREMFKPPTHKRKCVVVMPRKRDAGDLLLIRSAFERIWPQYARLPWFGLVDKPEATVAARLSEGAVFLSLSYREGLGLPPLEAMSAGCLVAGFTGVGGDEYATPENGFWAPEEDLFAAADAVGRALHTAVTDPVRARAMREAGYATVDHYSAHGMVADLKAFWSGLLGPPPNDTPKAEAAAAAAVLA